MSEVIFEWTTHFDPCSEEVYTTSLSTLLGDEGARKLVEIAKIYEQYDWFRLLLARINDQVAGELALYYEPLHGSHESWICVHPDFRKLGISNELMNEFQRNALKNGIRIHRADATMAHTYAQKYLFRNGYKAVGPVPMSFSFLPGQKSLGSAISVWKLLDPTLMKQWEEEQRESLDWEDLRWRW